MEEIQVGEYVRTKKGNIGKVIDIDKRNYWIDRYIRKESGIPYEFLEKNNEQLKNNIVKHSKNIIDLIEKDDFINGRLVLQVDYKNKNVCLLIPFSDTNANTNIMWYGFEDIKTILTHEQFENNIYRIGE